MLRSRLLSIELSLLPAVQDLLGNYPAEQLHRTGAYLVLAHAEFEYFIERACRMVAEDARDKFRKGNMTRTALAIVSFFSQGVATFPGSWTKATNSERQGLGWSERTEACFEKYLEIVKENNGIKQYNLVRLLAPLGYDLSLLPPSLLVECDNLGKTRGDLAHGNSQQAQQIVDPFSEKVKVDQLEVFFTQLAVSFSFLS